MNRRIGTLNLYGEDAREFANRLFRPTEEDINRQQRAFDRLNHSVLDIYDVSDGFTAEIEGLDLSFLDVPQDDEKIEVAVTVTISLDRRTDYIENSDVFAGNRNSFNTEIQVSVKKKTDNIPVEGLISIAA